MTTRCASRIAETRHHARVSHGLSGHRLYKTWKRMIARCYVKASAHFNYYGGRGIRVAESWMDFTNFLADMEKGYAPGLSIDRIDPDGHYTPENCRWADAKTQSANRRGVRLINIGDISTLLVDAARANGLNPETVALRIKSGMAPDEALRIPQKTNPNKRAVIINGVVYESLSAAGKALGVSRSAIFNRIKHGSARYSA